MARTGAGRQGAGGLVAGLRRLIAPLLGVCLRDGDGAKAPETRAVQPAKTPPPAELGADGLPLFDLPPVHPVPMTERLSAWRSGAALPLVLKGQVHVRIRNRDVTFCLNTAPDPIQNAHRAGKFYEQTELDALLALLPTQATVLDIGANVGNHALFLALFGQAARVVVIEPNPPALEPLVGNVLANRLEGVIDLGFLGFGLGETDSEGWGMGHHRRNLGGTRMKPGGGSLRVRRGDDVFPDLMPDLVKIDVEGMEMAVLAGLERMIDRARPLILVEIRDTHRDDFRNWAQARGYRIDTPGKKNRQYTNFLLRPKAAQRPTES